MTNINTSDDLVRVLRENPEFRATIRRELLTAELLEVPEQLTSLRESAAALLEHANETNRRLDETNRRLDGMDRRLDQVDQRIAQMDRRLDQVDRRLDGIEGDIKIVKRDIDGLGEAFRREVRAQSSFRGNYAQSAAGKDVLEVAGLFADLRGVKRTVTGPSWQSQADDVAERKPRRGGIARASIKGVENIPTTRRYHVGQGLVR